MYTLSGHAPKDLTDEDYEDDTFTPPAGTLYGSGARFYRYRLRDTFTDPMPGVWVQERFIDGSPLNLKNDLRTGYVWRTKLFPDPQTALGMNAEDGYFAAKSRRADYDTLAYFTNDPLRLGLQTTDHAFYAGNKDASNNATTGIPLGVYRITFVVVPLATRQRGPASQAKIR